MIERSMGRTLGAAAALSLALVACGGNPFGPDPEEVEFAASLGIDLASMTRTASGLYIRDDLVGEGSPAVVPDRVTITFTGWLVDGTVFDSGEVAFFLGNLKITDGLTEGLVGMRVGGTRTIVISADLAFGSQGGDGIPDNAVLVYELTLTALIRAQA